MPLEQITGTIDRILSRRGGTDDDQEASATWWLAALQVQSRKPEDRVCVKGVAHPDDFREGRSYVFHGRWDEPSAKYPGKTLAFEVVVPHEPNTRRGTMLYLADTCPGIGPVIACQIFDVCQLYEKSAIAVLRSDPDLIHLLIPRLSLENAREASAILKADAALQDTKIELRELFAGTGIPRAAIEACIRKWGPLAPRRIKRDPFTLLVSNIPGCGFARCDRLHSDFRLPADSIKRVVACAWHGIREDREGHTWYRLEVIKDKARREVGGVNIEAAYKEGRKDSRLIRALRIGKRAGTFAMRRDAAGVWWVADGQKARNEKLLAGYVSGLLAEPVVLPRFTEALPGVECYGDNSEDGIVAEEIDVSMADVEALAEIGRRLKICQFCGRELRHPNSLRHGYGPVCAGRHGLPWDDSLVAQELAVANA